MLHEASICSGCGEPRAESMDIANEQAYVVPPPHRCHACTALAQAAERDKEKSQPQALQHVLYIKPRKSERPSGR